jgi:polysaccharide biosynthesis/export protein
MSATSRTRCHSMVALGAFLGSAFVASYGTPQVAEKIAGDYRIGRGDVLDIVVWENEKLSRSVPVRPDGWISLPLVNDVRADGLTPMELQTQLAARLTEYISSPIVSVIVTSVYGFKVSVLGEVQSPGRYTFDGPATVLDAIASAGGFNEYASRDDTYLLRPKLDGYERIPIKYSHVGREGAAVNVDLKPGDILIVP